MGASRSSLFFVGPRANAEIGAAMRTCTFAILLITCLGSVTAPVARADEAVPPGGSQQPPGEGATSLADVLEGSSGVRVATMCTNCNVANVTMDGQTGEHVQVLKDGLPVVGGLAAVYLLSVMPGEGIAATDIVRGAGTVLSGPEAAVGAVAIRTLDPLAKREPYLFASSDVGSLDWQGQKVLAAGRAGPVGGVFTLTRAGSAASDPNRDGIADLGRFARTTLAGTGGFEISRRSRLRLDLVGYREDQRGNKGGWLGNGFASEDVALSRYEGSLGWTYTLPDRSHLTLRVRRANRDQDTSDDEVGIPQPYTRVREHSTLGEALYEKTFGGRYILTGGVSGSSLEVDGFSEKGGSPTLHLDDFVRYRSGFAQFEAAIGKRLDLTAGVIYAAYRMSGTQEGTYYPPSYEMGKVRFLPRARLAWKATHALTLSLAAGESLTPLQSPFERVCCGHIVYPNTTDNRAEVARSYLLDADIVPARWVKVRTSLFRENFTDYVQKLMMLAVSYAPFYGNVNYGGFSLEGGELSTEFRPLDRLSFGFQATRVRVPGDAPIPVNRDGAVLFELPAGTIPYLAETQGSAFVSWKDPKIGLELGVQAQYTGAMRIQVLQGGEPPLYLEMADHLESTPSFWAVNLSFRKRLEGGFSILAGIDNLTNTYQTHLDNPAYVENWGLLRGRYLYTGLTWER